jgi:hypothetical protein
VWNKKSTFRVFSWSDFSEPVPNGWRNTTWGDFDMDLPNGWKQCAYNFSKQHFDAKTAAVKQERFNMLRTNAAGAHGEKPPPQGWARSIAEGLINEDAIYAELCKLGFKPTEPNVRYEPFYKDRMPDMKMWYQGREVVIHCKSATAPHWQDPEIAARTKGAVFQWWSRGNPTRFNMGKYNRVDELLCFGVTQKQRDGSVKVTLSKKMWLTPMGECVFEGMNNGNPNKRCVKDYHF